jgi:hypothetical protein
MFEVFARRRALLLYCRLIIHAKSIRVYFANYLLSSNRHFSHNSYNRVTTYLLPIPSMEIVMQLPSQDTADERHSKIARTLFFACPVVLIAVQLVPGPSHVNPRINIRETLEANANVPAPVSAMFERACANCHSNNTQWPWYSRVAPMSWMVAKDVEDARKAMNLSRWSVQNGRRPELAIATLTAACSDLQTGRMPKWNYLLAHPEARVSKEEVAGFCTWSQGEIKQLVRKKQEQSKSKFTKLLQTGNDKQ